ncbi:MAG: hypothetical protein KF752_11685 [Pirellulaceae bacterium]|nr:hypothetical protein [Pirellulaceae bacterium]
MPSQFTTPEKCPHCESDLPIPPGHWNWAAPWQCSHCGGMYAVRMESVVDASKKRIFAIPADLKPLWPLFSWEAAKSFGFHADTRYYVYAICYPNGLPMYVGRGKKLRVCQHIDELRRLPLDRWKEKHFELHDLLIRNQRERYHFLALVDHQSQAAQIERAFVLRWQLRRYGGLLVNSAIPDAAATLTTQADDCKCQALDEGSKPDTSMAVDRHPDGRQPIFHLDMLDRFCGSLVDYTCGVCRREVSVPRDLQAEVVQCPHCAHLFVPQSEGWAPARRNFW